MGQIVSLGGDLPASVDEGVGVLGGVNGIQHYGYGAAGGIFHPGGHVKAADGNTMLLVLYGTGSDGYVGKDVRNVPPIFRVEHFVRRSQTRLNHGTDMHFPHGDQAGQKIRFFFGVRLMHDPLIAFSGGPGLVGIDSGNQNQLVLYFIVYPCKTVHIVTYGIFIVRRAGSDDYQKTLVSSGEDFSDLGIAFPFYLGKTRRQGEFFLDFFRGGQFLYKLKTHGGIILSSVSSYGL